MAARHSPFPRFQAHEGQARPGWSRIDLGGHEVVSQLHMRMRSGAQAAGEGRHALDRLDGALDTAQLGELRLLVTELLTNSVRHGAGPEDWITLDVEIYANAVRVVVTDRGPGFQPEPTPQPHLDTPGGWGLCLVDRLADRWGVNCDETNEVWFELDRSPFATAA
jgi:anti-sigma regulatory factor (Ser/Thr protein kinase)